MKKFNKGILFICLMIMGTGIVGVFSFFYKMEKGGNIVSKSLLWTKLKGGIGVPDNKGMSIEEAAQIMPLYPSVVSAEILNNTVLIKWRGTGGAIDYEILRKIAGTEKWIQVARMRISEEENRGWFEWQDINIKPGTSYIYGVRALSSEGLPSKVSESAVLEFP